MTHEESYLQTRWLGCFLPFGSVTYPGMFLHLHGKMPLSECQPKLAWDWPSVLAYLKGNHSKPATPGELKFYEMGSKIRFANFKFKV